MTNQINLAFAKFDEVEELHRQRELDMEKREAAAKQSTERISQETHEKLANVFCQLEQTQVALRELTVEYTTKAATLEKVSFFASFITI